MYSTCSCLVDRKQVYSTCWKQVYSTCSCLLDRKQLQYIQLVERKSIQRFLACLTENKLYIRLLKAGIFNVFLLPWSEATWVYSLCWKTINTSIFNMLKASVFNILFVAWQKERIINILKASVFNVVFPAWQKVSIFNVLKASVLNVFLLAWQQVEYTQIAFNLLKENLYNVFLLAWQKTHCIFDCWKQVYSTCPCFLDRKQLEYIQLVERKSLQRFLACLTENKYIQRVKCKCIHHFLAYLTESKFIQRVETKSIQLYATCSSLLDREQVYSTCWKQVYSTCLLHRKQVYSTCLKQLYSTYSSLLDRKQV